MPREVGVHDHNLCLIKTDCYSMDVDLLQWDPLISSTAIGFCLLSGFQFLYFSVR